MEHICDLLCLHARATRKNNVNYALTSGMWKTSPDTICVSDGRHFDAVIYREFALADRSPLAIPDKHTTSCSRQVGRYKVLKSRSASFAMVDIERLPSPTATRHFQKPSSIDLYENSHRPGGYREGYPARPLPGLSQKYDPTRQNGAT